NLSHASRKAFLTGYCKLLPTRKRRASIKTSYNDLREVIPGLRGSKASRAVILQRAVECIEELVKLNRDHTVCVETLKRQNDILDSRVSLMF
ncbi:unnamed protein product, partial [Trichobilharzia regenti]